MSMKSTIILSAALLLLVPNLVGCCCSCGGTLPPLQVPQPNVVDGGTDDGDNIVIDDNGNPPDPAVAEELKTAKEWAQKALTAKGAGTVRTVDLRKDGVNWYVSGSADTLDGPAPYEVWFQVTRSGDRQIWAVKTVKVNDKTIFP